MQPDDAFWIGPLAGVYIGDAGGSGLLQQIFTKRTKGSTFKRVVPKRWNPRLKKYTQNGNQTITFGLTFYGCGGLITRINYANSVDTPSGADDAPGGSTNYSILMIHENPDIKASIYVPECSVVTDFELAAQKQYAEVTLQFRWEDPSEFARLSTKETALLAAAAAGVRNPYT